MVLASPEIGGLPAPIIGLMAYGGMAAALSTAAYLLLVISSAASHDIYYRMISKEQASNAKQMLVARIAMGVAVVIAVIGGLNPPGFVAQVVALAFGIAASTLLPVLILGVFWKKANAKGAVTGMLAGLIFSVSYMIYTLEIFGTAANDHVFGISPRASV
ncbi:hypothetical protein [Nesterenkonia pannonica]|uniref:sodium:solute symporter family transporter n=1 Tax=Nesterenkonia pannonica TaxID=1548602 RepID=UPI002164C089|nr:hypothetical protein [Nesterenkonia pannonica]